MFLKYLKFIGIFLIIILCAISIFFSVAEREIEDPTIRELIAFPSFFEDRFYDLRMQLTLEEEKVDERIVLAKIDDSSIKKIGRFPWSRQIWADIIRKLKGYGAKVVAFDVFFSEEERSCNEESPDFDFAKSIQEFQADGSNFVVLPYSLASWGEDYYEEVPDSLYNFIMDTKQIEGVNLSPNLVSKSVFPLQMFSDTEAPLGHIQASEDVDGIFRHYRVIANVDTLYFPSFGLLPYQIYTGDKPTLEMLSPGDAKLKFQTGTLFLNYKGESKVRWLGGVGHFPEVSLQDILQAPENDPNMQKTLAGNIVYVGSTAFGAHDLRHTPVDPMLPGVYFHMNLTHMLLEGKFFKPKDESTMISWSMLVGGTLIMILVMFFGHAILDLFAVVGISSILFLIDTYYLIPMGHEIKLFFCLLSIISCYSWVTFLNFYLASKDKAFLKSAFSSYISPELIDEMYNSGEPPKLGGEVGLITAFFTDIQGFSTFSEKLSAPKLVELLNEYLTAMTDILLKHLGTLDKYEGDAIIAFFGAPMKLEDHAIRACRVACEMQDKLGELREKWTSEGDKWPEIVHSMRMRVGINSGEIVTGNMGSLTRMNYTMMGDSVNLAARLEEAAKQYGIFSQVSMFTNDLTNDQFIMRELDTIKVVGKSEPVTTYDLMGEVGKTEDMLIKLRDVFHEGLALYKNKEFVSAKEKFNESLELEYARFPELKGKKTNPSLVYLERCEQFIENPPPADWDGVFTLTSK